MKKETSTINCGGKLIDLSTPIVMGILNVTPDSFYDGGRYSTEKQWIELVQKMITDGAGMVDIGAISTRPGAMEVSEEEEFSRLSPAVKAIRREFPNFPISIDTWRSQIAKQSIDAGANIINDISGGLFDQEMFATIAKLNVPYIMMHTGGRPEVMQENPKYNNLVNDIIEFFAIQLQKLRELGVHDIIIDPGFGFGKTLDHNYQLLAKLGTFQLFELPILVGISRKSMIQKFLNRTSDESLNGTSVIHTIALMQGASILRVHDVKEAVEAVQIVKKTNLYTSERL